MKDANQLKQDIDIAYEDLAPQIVELHDYLFENPETAFQEYKAATRLTDMLAGEDFEIEIGVGGLETAFTAEFDFAKQAKNPIHIGIIAEYDALPEIGHACGHNLIAAAAFGAAASLKRVINDAGIPGVIKVIGTPAEEDGGGKVILLEHGVFDHLSVCMMMHPTSGVSRIAGNCLSSHELTLTWTGRSAHAESHPEDGVNALDALNIYYTAVACLRQQLPADVRIAHVVAESSCNLGVIPDRAVMSVDIVSEDANLIPTVNKVKKCAEGAAIASGCNIKIDDHIGYLGRLPNQTLCDVFKSNLQLIGEPVMDGMPGDFGTTDFGNVMRQIPSCNPYISLLTEKKISNHTEQFKALAHSERAVRVIEIGSKSMAYSAVDLLTDNKLLRKAMQEFERSISDL